MPRSSHSSRFYHPHKRFTSHPQNLQYCWPVIW
jgi:hypothetical protein